MSTPAIQGPWALVTGASSGLGADFARELAARGFHLVLVARRIERLEALAAEIQTAHPVQVRCEGLDLAEPGSAGELERRLEGVPVEVLVNNAGIGPFGSLLDQSWNRTQTMLQLNIEALTDLTCRFAPGMRARGRGHVLLVGSIAAFLPAPRMAAYAATKAYVSSLGEALHREWKGTGVVCTVLHPGYTATEFFEQGDQIMGGLGRLTVMPSRKVAQIGLKAMFKGRASVVAGCRNLLVPVLSRLLPRQVNALMAERLV